jgi:hypothetical protein
MLPTSVVYYIKININLPVQLHSFPTSSHILSVTHLLCILCGYLATESAYTEPQISDARY